MFQSVSCPICSFSVNRSSWFYRCNACKTLSLFPRIGLPVNKEQALDNLSEVIQNRKETAMKQVVRQEPELNIVVKTVFDDEELDGFIITIDDCFFIHYLEESED